LFYHEESGDYIEVANVEEARHLLRTMPELEDVTDEAAHEMKFKQQVEDET
jgi:hypothetical protein